MCKRQKLKLLSVFNCDMRGQSEGWQQKHPATNHDGETGPWQERAYAQYYIVEAFGCVHVLSVARRPASLRPKVCALENQNAIQRKTATALMFA